MPPKMSDSAVCFRVRGIPLDLDKSEADKHIKRALGLPADAKMCIRSLAPDPHTAGKQMATAEFDTTPEFLSRDKSTREWNVSCDSSTTKGSRLSMTVDSHFEGITVLHWPKEGKWETDVIALPGLGGHAFESFKSEESTQMWLRDYLPRNLPEARVLTYGYDSRLAGRDPSQYFRDLARGFLSEIKSIRTPSEASKERKPILFIGHDLGGLVLKQAILEMMQDAPQAQDKEILESITGILFFGVPNHGMNIEPVLPMVHDSPNEDLIRTLQYKSEILMSQSKQFFEQFQGKRWGIDLDRVKRIFFYETQTSPTAKKVDGTWTMNGLRTVLLEKESATDGKTRDKGNHFVKPFDTDHFGMVKFITRHDEYYLTALTVLKDLVTERKDWGKKQ